MAKLRTILNDRRFMKVILLIDVPRARGQTSHNAATFMYLQQLRTTRSLARCGKVPERGGA